MGELFGAYRVDGCIVREVEMLSEESDTCREYERNKTSIGTVIPQILLLTVFEMLSNRQSCLLSGAGKRKKNSVGYAHLLSRLSQRGKKGVCSGSRS
jgi:hypothetical protein